MNASKTIRRIAVTGLSVFGLLGAQLALATGPAGAVTGYGEPTFFGAAGSGNGQFNEPVGVAIDEASKDVYVVDQGNNRVQKFDAEGKYMSQFNGSANPSFPTGFSSPNAVAVDNSVAGESKGDVYVVDAGHNVIDKFSSAGAFLFELNGFASPVIAVAVDPSGHLWVVEKDSEEKAVQEFNGELHNKSINSMKPEFKHLPGIAVDSREDIYLIKGFENVAAFDRNGNTLTETATTCTCSTALAIDPATNVLFVDQGSSIAQYTPFAEPYGSAPVETLEAVSASYGVAVSGATHTVYASQQQAGSVAIFKTVLLPEVTTIAPASEIERTTVKLEGEVNPDGQEVTTCEFEYGTSTNYGQSAPCETPPGSGLSFVPVIAKPVNLTPETTYHYRLTAGNSNRVRPNAGLDATFTTPPAVQNLQTLPASNKTATAATLNGSFESTNLETSYLFEYGTTGSYGSSMPALPAKVQGSAGTTSVNADISGLLPDQEYHYRIVAENTLALGKTNGQDTTFKTAVLAPVIPGEPSAEFVTAQTAVLGASLNPEHTSTRYQFEYGPCPTLSGCATIQSTPAEASTVYGTIGTSAELVGLQPSTTYSYRLVANNEFEEGGKMLGGKTTGLEGTFKTVPASIPRVETGAYTVLGATSAVISGLVEPHGVPTSYTFELGIYNGTSTQYGVVASGSAGVSVVPVPASLTLTGLQPGTTYAYRLSISSGYILNETHTLQAATVVFTTPGLPSVLTPPLLLAQLPVPNIKFPSEAAKVTPKKLTRAQKLANALKACAKKPKNKRAACRRAAQRKYGSSKTKKKK
jgi:phosphodiesterase/alkaline phosphatase D-like protein